MTIRFLVLVRLLRQVAMTLIIPLYLHLMILLDEVDHKLITAGNMVLLAKEMK